jgi:hypothetical protein
MIMIILSQAEIFYNVQVISSFDKNKEVYLRTPTGISKSKIDRNVYYRIDTTLNDLSNLDILIYDKKTKKEKIIPLPKFINPKSLEISVGETLTTSFDFLGFPISEFESPRVYIISEQGESEAFLLQQDPYNIHILGRNLEPIDEVGNYKLALVINHPKQLLEIRIYRSLNVVYKPIYKFYAKNYGFSNQPGYICIQIYNKLPKTISENYTINLLDPKGTTINISLRNYGDYACVVLILSEAGTYKAKIEGEYKAVLGSKTITSNIVDSMSFEVPIRFLGFEIKNKKGFIKLENVSNRPINLIVENVEAPQEIKFNISGNYPISQNTQIPFEYKFLKKIPKNKPIFVRIKFKDNENNFYFLDVKILIS